ncbi:Protein of unknown function [Gryllus bimaculatus]|nr:Protein of unknown function [Gryllus bimaculatus]
MDAIPPGVDEDWAVEYLFRGRKSRKDKRLMLQEKESNAASYRLLRYRRQTGEAPIDERLAPNPSNPSPEKGKKYVTGRQGPPQSGSKPGAKPRAKRGTKPSAKPRTKLGRDPDSEPEPQSEPQSEPQHEVEKPFGAACLKAASSKMGPIKKMFKEKFDTFCNRSEKRFSIVIIVVDFIMLILNIMLVVTCYCFIVSVRRKEVNLAIGFVVLAAVCLCINPCYWVIRLAMTPPWGYFNGVRIALTVIFLLLFWGVFFFAIVMAAKFFYFCFLVELDSTSPLVQQSDVDQKTMKRDIET